MSPFSFRVALATVGGGTFELITPHSGRSVFEEHLEEHGESFHHTCLIYPSLEAVREAKAEFRRQGRELVQEASGGDVFDFSYFRFPEIGSLVEVLYLDPAKLPAPEGDHSPFGIAAGVKRPRAPDGETLSGMRSRRRFSAWLDVQRAAPGNDGP